MSLTPATIWLRNFARSALLNSERRTEAICTRHDNACNDNTALILVHVGPCIKLKKIHVTQIRTLAKFDGSVIQILPSGIPSKDLHRTQKKSVSHYFATYLYPYHLPLEIKSVVTRDRDQRIIVECCHLRMLSTNRKK